MKNLKPLDQSHGAIKRMLLIASSKYADKGATAIRKELNELLRPFISHCPDIEFWFLIPFNEEAGQKASFIDDRRVQTNLDFRFLARQMARSGMLGPNINMDNIQDHWTPNDWVQDQFFVLVGPENSSVLLDPYYSWMNFDEVGCKGNPSCLSEIVGNFLPSIISSQSDAFTKSTPHFFQGGNVIGGNDVVFIGRDIVCKNFKAICKNSNSEFSKKKFWKFWGRLSESFLTRNLVCPGLTITDDGIEFLGEKPQQWTGLPDGIAHLDRFVVYTGLDDNQNQGVLLGEMFHNVDTGSEVDWVRTSEPSSESQRILTGLKAWFEDPAAHGFQYPFRFKVDRIPTLKLGHGNEIFFSANCHLHTSKYMKHVFVAKFAAGRNARSEAHISADAQIANSFRENGFEPVTISGALLNGAASQHAGLHCLTKVLMRE